MKLLHFGLLAEQTPLNGLSKAFRNSGVVFREVSARGASMQRVVDVVKEFRPDVVFMQLQCDLKQDGLFNVIRGNSGFVLNWTGDVRDDIPDWYMRVSKYVDLTLFSNMRDVRNAQMPSGYLQNGYDPEIFSMGGVFEERSALVVFMANNYDGRFPLSDLRKCVVGELSVLRNGFHLFGSGWPLMCMGSTISDQYVESAIYRGSIVAINCSHYAIERYFSDRLLRILGSGVFCLSHSWPGLDIDFSPGSHFVVWDSVEDMKAKLSWYLARPQEMWKIAEAGFAQVRSNFTYSNMVSNLLEIVNCV